MTVGTVVVVSVFLASFEVVVGASVIVLSSVFLDVGYVVSPATVVETSVVLVDTVVGSIPGV